MVSQESVPLSTVRQAWRTLEPYHALIYFVPEARAAYKDLGLKGSWMGYFASRSAPLGPASVSLITATFYNFHRSMVARAIPDAWHLSTPELILAARYQAADAALRRLLQEAIASPEIIEAADLARLATQGCDIAGRPLFAAYNDLPWPTEPHLVLWHAATLLREFRAEGHIASLMVENLDGCEAHVTLIGSGSTTREQVQPHRGWSDAEWEAAQARLQSRGLLDETNNLTVEGTALRQSVEDRTDLLALPPWQHLGQEKTLRLLQLTAPFTATVLAQGAIPVPNPMGLR